jgi:chromosomal replication initiator protein
VTLCANGTVTQLEARIADKIGPKRFAIWFKNSTRFNFADPYLTITTPNHYVGDFVERTFADVIREAAREVTSNDYLLSFAIDPDIAKTLSRHQPDRQVDYVITNPDRVARRKKRGRGLPVTPVLRGRLDEFVVGPSNRLAYAAALGVVESPAARYNPLFIHGGCGIGKTHLLQGICNALTKNQQGLTWRYVSGEDFMNDYVFAVRAREMDVFHERYRHLDVLVIDDVHFLANKRATQEEFLNTVKAIDTAGKQLVLASDAHPRMIGHFSEALISRFLSGMVVRIEPPDHEVRMGVLRRRAATLKVSVGDGVLEYIAENFTANVRELEGALLKVVAHAQVSGEPITPALAQRAIRDVVRQTAPVVMLSDIESVVAIYFGLRPADLHTSRKSRTIALSRGIAMYLARKHTEMSFPEIGRFMGNKNHSTVILACRRIATKLQNNESVSWLTPEGLKERKLDTLIAELEEQFERPENTRTQGRKPSRAESNGRAVKSGNAFQPVAASVMAG